MSSSMLSSLKSSLMVRFRRYLPKVYRKKRERHSEANPAKKEVKIRGASLMMRYWTMCTTQFLPRCRFTFSDE